MSERSNRALRGGIRAVTGIVVVAVAASLAVLVGNAPLPAVTRDPIAVQVDTRQSGERAVVCAGSFAQLGADPQEPGAAVPAGTASTVVAGTPSSQSELARERAGGTAPTVLRAPVGEPFAAAQTQAVSTPELRGLAAQACVEPANEQWLVGGTTAVGAATTLNLGNPSEKAATVELTVFDEDGQVDSAMTSGVLVPAGSERIVSLNGYAPGRERLAVRVVSTGAAVSASLGFGQVDGLQSYAVDAITRQLAPETRLVVPGVMNRLAADEGPTDADHLEGSPVLVRALAADGGSGRATVSALFGGGAEAEVLGEIELSGSAVGELEVPQWPAGALAVVIDSEVPIVGGVMGAAAGNRMHDTAWFAPAPELPVDEPVAAPVVGGQLVLVNDGDTEAAVRVGAGEAERSYRVPAGGALAVQTGRDSLIVSDAPLHAGVSIASGGDIAGYPVQADLETSVALTVHPR